MVYRLSWLAALAGVSLAVGRLSRLLSQAETGPPWQLAVIASLVLGGIITWAALTYRVGYPTLVALNAVGLAFIGLRIAAPGTARFGIIPTAETFDVLGTELGFAQEVIRWGSAPVLPVAGLVLVLAVVFWLIGALVAFGFTTGRPWIALLPAPIFYLQLATIDRGPSGWWIVAFLLVVALSLAALHLDERTRGTGRLRSSESAGLLSVANGRWTATFVVIPVVLAIGASALASGLVPPTGYVDWRSRTGIGGGIQSGISYNLFAGIVQEGVVSNDPTPVFVAQVEGDQLPENPYWKLTNLDIYDGTNWLPGSLAKIRDPGDGVPFENPQHAFGGETATVTQTITIDTLQMNYLPLLYSPRGFQSENDFLRNSYQLRDDGSLKIGGVTRQGFEYEVFSQYPKYDAAALATMSNGALSPIFEFAAAEGQFEAEPKVVTPLPPPENLDDYRELPDDLDNSIPALTREITRDGATPFERALMIETFLRDTRSPVRGGAGFTYDATIAAGHGAEDLAAWLTDPASPSFRTGYCEQFSTAMGVMARTLNIPSRLVLGFAPGDRVGDTITVRQKDAHAWVELWLPAQGWVRFDPTPRTDGINPSTVQASVRFNPYEFVPPVEEELDTPERPDREEPGVVIPPFSEPPEGFDVVTVTPLDTEPFRVPLWGWILLGLALLASVIPLLKWRRRRRRLRRAESGDISGLWEEIVDRLSDLGTPVSEGQTPREVAEGVSAEMVPLAHAYSRSIYGREGSATGQETAAESFAALESEWKTRFPPRTRAASWFRLRSFRR